MFLKQKIPIDQTVGAFLYPDRIIIETRNKDSNSSWYATDSITILSNSVSDDELGEIILKHLSESEIKPFSPATYKETRKNYRKKAKFNSEIATMKNAKYTSIFRLNDVIRFEPKNNKVSYGRQAVFLGMPQDVFELNSTFDFNSIANATRRAWEKCIFS